MIEEPSDNPGGSAPAVDFLRGHSTAVLRTGAGFRAVRYVVGADGSPVIFGPRAWLADPSLVLFIPADAEGALELMVEPVEEDGQGADADRWRTYHREAGEALCLRLEIEAGKFRGEVFDGDDLTRANPCASFEPALCRWMNSQHRADVTALCRHFNRVEVDEALLVGADPTGFDIRAKAGIIRVEAPGRISSEAEARATLDRMCREAGGAKP